MLVHVAHEGTVVREIAPNAAATLIRHFGNLGNCIDTTADIHFRIFVEEIGRRIGKSEFLRRIINDGRDTDPVADIPLETDAEFRARIEAAAKRRP